MMKRSTRRWILIIMVLLLGACAGNGEEARTFSLDDNGSRVEVRVGDEITINLESNATTGFTWETVEAADPQMALLEDGTYHTEGGDDPDSPPPPGTGGWQTYRLQGASLGEATFSAIYHRSWEEDVEPEKTFTLTFVVTG